MFNGQRVVAVIPSRIGSTRLPRKALVDICGLPMIIHVLKRAHMSPIVDDIFVATDSDEIRAVVENHGGKTILTSSVHTTGIERIEEALRDIVYDIAVLINGDEAALNPAHIQSSVEALISSDAPTSLLASYFTKTRSTSDFKVVVNLYNEALYFSREDIPSPSRSGIENFLKACHIISFRSGVLAKYIELARTPLETLEGHDHLRFIEHGLKVKIGIVENTGFSVDTYEDLEEMRIQMQLDAIFCQYNSENE